MLCTQSPIVGALKCRRRQKAFVLLGVCPFSSIMHRVPQHSAFMLWAS